MKYADLIIPIRHTVLENSITPITYLIPASESQRSGMVFDLPTVNAYQDTRLCRWLKDIVSRMANIFKRQWISCKKVIYKKWIKKSILIRISELAVLQNVVPSYFIYFKGGSIIHKKTPIHY